MKETEMSLLNTATATTAAFEADMEDAATDATTSTSTAVATTRQTAVAVPVMTQSVIDTYRNRLKVDYNTLTALSVNNGNFVMREGKKPIGSELCFKLQSYQDHYVVSPNNDKAPVEIVRFSDDGVTCSDGTNVQEHLDWLKRNGYPTAKLQQRTIVVGAVLSCSDAPDLVGTLVQIDLAPMSRTQWNRYMANSAFQIEENLKTADQVLRIKGKATLADSKGKSFTMAVFSCMA